MERLVQASTDLPFPVYVTTLRLIDRSWWLTFDLEGELKQRILPVTRGTDIGVSWPRALSRSKPALGAHIDLVNGERDQAFEVVGYDGYLHFGEDYLVHLRAL